MFPFRCFGRDDLDVLGLQLRSRHLHPRHHLAGGRERRGVVAVAGIDAATRREVGLVPDRHGVKAIAARPVGDRGRPRVVAALHQVSAVVDVVVGLATGGRAPDRPDDLGARSGPALDGRDVAGFEAVVEAAGVAHAGPENGEADAGAAGIEEQVGVRRRKLLTPVVVDAEPLNRLVRLTELHGRAGGRSAGARGAARAGRAGGAPAGRAAAASHTAAAGAAATRGAAAAIAGGAGPSRGPGRRAAGARGAGRTRRRASRGARRAVGTGGAGLAGRSYAAAVTGGAGHAGGPAAARAARTARTCGARGAAHASALSAGAAAAAPGEECARQNYVMKSRVAHFGLRSIPGHVERTAMKLRTFWPSEARLRTARNPRRLYSREGG